MAEFYISLEESKTEGETNIVLRTRCHQNNETINSPTNKEDFSFKIAENEWYLIAIAWVKKHPNKVL